MTNVGFILLSWNIFWEFHHQEVLLWINIKVIKQITSIWEDVINSNTTHPAFISSKLTTETLEQGVKFVQS